MFSCNRIIILHKNRVFHKNLPILQCSSIRMDKMKHIIPCLYIFQRCIIHVVRFFFSTLATRVEIDPINLSFRLFYFEICINKFASRSNSFSREWKIETDVVLSLWNSTGLILMHIDSDCNTEKNNRLKVREN